MTKTLLALLTVGLAAGVLACVDDPAAPPQPPKESELILYWHFNNLPEDLDILNVPADFSKVGTATITYPGGGAARMDRTDEASDLNLRLGVPPGFALRPRNPSNDRQLLIVAPSTGYSRIVVTFAVMRTSNGAEGEEFSYSTDGGATWNLVGTGYSVNLSFELKTFDFTDVEGVSNNANLRFRVRFTGPAAAGSSGNHRFDNLTIEGVPL